MTLPRIEIDADIRRAASLPSEIYTDPEFFEIQKERVFRKSWHFLGDTRRIKSSGAVMPKTILPDCLDEHVILARDGEEIRCLSNVCTHRGAIVVPKETKSEKMTCPYHGRRFKLDGTFDFMPEFEEAEDFPTPADNLAEVPHGRWGRFAFASPDPTLRFEEWIGPMRRRLDWVPFDKFKLDPKNCRDYEIDANWALYVDNYLEGFHIPYVHKKLNDKLDYGSYQTETFSNCSLQLGIASKGEKTFKIPAAHPDQDRKLAAYYFWLFPSTMFNLYPWGLSINTVAPLAHNRTRITYRTYVADKAKRGTGAGGDLHQVEKEDDAIVESVMRGVRSRFYKRGRYSPTREQGVHHFHWLLAEFMNYTD